MGWERRNDGYRSPGARARPCRHSLRPGARRAAGTAERGLTLMSIEIMLNAAGLAFVVAGARWQQPDGQVMFIFILAMAAAELSLIHISEPTRLGMISYAVF